MSKFFRSFRGVALFAVGALLGGVVVAVTYRYRPSNPVRQTQAFQEVTSKPLAVSSHSVVPSLNPKSNSFWRRVESTNYVDYIRNMRSAGVPEVTIADIITADVDSLFQKQIDEIGKEFKRNLSFWASSYGRAGRQAASQGVVSEKLGAVFRQKAEILRQLLNINYDADRALETELAKLIKDADHVPEYVNRRVQQVEAEYRDRVLNREPGLPVDQREQYRAMRDKDAKLAEILTPEQKLEYDLRNSSTADTLRSELSLFRPSEAEFREIFKLRKEFDDRITDARLENKNGFETLPDDYASQQSELNRKIESILGPERYAEYTRSSDGIYTSALGFTRQNGISDDTAVQLYNIRYGISDLYQHFVTDRNLEGPAREAVLNELKNRAVRQVQEALGPDTYRLYEGSGEMEWANRIIKGVIPAPIKR